MKHITKIACMLLLVAIGSACERDLESEGIAKGIIRYPDVRLNGGNSFTLVAGEGSYQELGAEATLGTDDITDQIEISGVADIDENTPGVYPVNYSVSVENEIGQQSTVVRTRYVIVNSEDISDVDLSGDYIGYGFAANPITVRVTKLSNGWYSIPDVLSSSNGIAVSFAHIGGDVIEIPNQTTGFGDVNTTSGGASGEITANGFSWSVFISCCGVFGPIDFVKQ